jgi:DNA-directed RNA polymerase beta subunit
MIKKNEIDITPKTKIYSIFQNMNYKLETAISEFVDNSIASFRENKEYFDNNEIEKTIILFFDNTMNKIIIFDNAYGISNNDFPRVLRLAELPKDTSGLNEYGMGLKASSFWLGNSLKVVSKYRDNSYSNELKVTLDELEKGKNKIEVSKNESYLKIPYLKNGHGTFIEINGVRRNMTTSVLTPLVKILSSKYRNDIYDNTNIKIIAKESTNKIIDICKTNFEKKKSFLNNDELYKATSLFYKEVEFYKNEKNEIYRKEKFFEIKHLIDGKIKKLKFSGVFGIKKHGTRKEYYAFDLFRRKRIVKSGYDPSHLFGIGNSFETLRITG